ncbi:MAG: SRPBCC family protein [Solirubrobacterales bacterium]|nr:SRPBCC family protein [Solirubrobacterales bacterium]
MAKANGVVHSPLSASTVFERVADFSTTQEWDPGVVEAERLSDGPLEIGATFRVVAAFMGSKSELVYRITEFEPGHRVVLRGENSTVLSVDVITVDASGDGSVLTYDADLTLKGPLRLLDPLLGLAFGRIADRALAGLTEWLKS